MSYGKKKIDLLYENLTYKINGVLFATHNELGRFAREKQYADLVEKKFREINLSFKREISIGDSGNILDFVVEEKIILEFKAKPLLLKEDHYQLQRYLYSVGLKLGILVNFRSPYLKPKRVLRPIDVSSNP
jgi:GxxExxY protein